MSGYGAVEFIIGRGSLLAAPQILIEGHDPEIVKNLVEISTGNWDLDSLFPKSIVKIKKYTPTCFIANIPAPMTGLNKFNDYLEKREMECDRYLSENGWVFEGYKGISKIKIFIKEG